MKYIIHWLCLLEKVEKILGIWCGLNMKNIGDMKWTKRIYSLESLLWFMEIEIKLGESSSNLFIVMRNLNLNSSWCF